MKVVKQRFCRAVTALIAASMITGCASDKTDTKLNVALHPDKPMRVFVGNCTINEPFLEGQDQAAIAAIGGILLSSLIKVGVDRIGTALENSAKARTATLISSLNFDATAKERPACIQIIRGKFKNDKHIGSGSDQPSTLGQWHVDRLPENVADASKFKENLAKNGAILASDPEFFFEGRFVFSEDFFGLCASARPSRTRSACHTRSHGREAGHFRPRYNPETGSRARKGLSHIRLASWHGRTEVRQILRATQETC